MSVGEFETPSTIHHNHQRGRPPFDVDTEQIIFLRENRIYMGRGVCYAGDEQDDTIQEAEASWNH